MKTRRKKKSLAPVYALFFRVLFVFILDSHTCVRNMLHFDGVLGRRWLCQKFNCRKSLCKRMCKCVIYLIKKNNRFTFVTTAKGTGPVLRPAPSPIRGCCCCLPYVFARRRSFFFFQNLLFHLHRPSREKMQSSSIILKRKKSSHAPQGTNSGEAVYLFGRVEAERRNSAD